MYDWKPYVPVAERRRKAAQKLAKLAKGGREISPVIIIGRTVATTFWGKAWNDNLEAYSDYSNRLPRGRTYVRNGSVLDLQISTGEVHALVSGSEIYSVKIEVSPVAKEAWAAICRDCAGGIESLVELLQGRLSKGVMERICRQQTGLFPSPKDIKLSCSCPDWASMCKHVAAVLYGVGARLDQHPELLFTLRKVQVQDLLASAGKGLPLSKVGPARGKVLEEDSFADLFDLDMADALPTKATSAIKQLPATKPPKQAKGHTPTKAKAKAVPQSKAGGKTIPKADAKTPNASAKAPIKAPGQTEASPNKVVSKRNKPVAETKPAKVTPTKPQAQGSPSQAKPRKKPTPKRNLSKSSPLT